MNQDDEGHEEGARSFVRVLENVNYGEAAIDLSEELHTVIGQLSSHAEKFEVAVKGKLKVTLEIEVTPHREVRITVGSSSTVNKPKAHGSTAWLTPGGNVTFEHPRQLGLPLKEVIDGKTGEIRDINDGVADARGKSE